MSAIAFVPARKGSKRIKNKNILPLNNHPLLAYTINIALKSKLFSHIFCITDTKKYSEIANYYGAQKFPLRPKSTSTSKATDDMWVNWATNLCEKKKISFDYFSILRPTSPFRTVKMIRKSLEILKKKSQFDSVRAVEKTPIHPGKIWEIKKNQLLPLLKKYNKKGIPWHSCQYAGLPKFFSQNASLETIKKNSFKKYKLISGKKIFPLITSGIEGFDINNNIDYELSKLIIKKTNKYKLSKKSYFKNQ